MAVVNLTHVSGTKLDTPVPQEGGFNFAHMHQDAPIPGSSHRMPCRFTPACRKVLHRRPTMPRREEVEKGREPLVRACGDGAGRQSQHQSGDRTPCIRCCGSRIRVRRRFKVIDDAVRAKEATKAPGYPGFADQEKLQEWLNRGLAERRALTEESADTAAVLKATGVDAGHAVFANTDSAAIPHTER